MSWSAMPLDAVGVALSFLTTAELLLLRRVARSWNAVSLRLIGPHTAQYLCTRAPSHQEVQLAPVPVTSFDGIDFDSASRLHVLCNAHQDESVVFTHRQNDSKASRALATPAIPGPHAFSRGLVVNGSLCASLCPPSPALPEHPLQLGLSVTPACVGCCPTVGCVAVGLERTVRLFRARDGVLLGTAELPGEVDAVFVGGRSVCVARTDMEGAARPDTALVHLLAVPAAAAPDLLHPIASFSLRGVTRVAAFDGAAWCTVTHCGELVVWDTAATKAAEPFVGPALSPPFAAPAPNSRVMSQGRFGASSPLMRQRRERVLTQVCDVRIAVSGSLVAACVIDAATQGPELWFMARDGTARRRIVLRSPAMLALHPAAPLVVAAPIHRKHTPIHVAHPFLEMLGDGAGDCLCFDSTVIGASDSGRVLHWAAWVSSCFGVAIFAALVACVWLIVHDVWWSNAV